ncbi:T9SS type A sorting domain-containing protein [Flammeovirga agarivorans]|uniref:T9SS type A sorting domain-containing protein n=1 Tax=Flammeovirga agarivorans TaxID=2726742 RepID=A0A7X8SP79_9BACT|nr:T9SS type A sorting domain-containing protein [Flammeovirga agarivorans]NLR93861.1 T9SS type A sorting domain-containing protein [Flammeovirga agarivorans]
MQKVLLLFFAFLPSWVFAEYDQSLEAEKALFSSGAVLTTNVNASGGEFMKIEPDEWITFDINDITESGTYALQVFKFNGGSSQQVEIKSNDNDFQEYNLNPSNWAYVGPAVATLLEIELKEGDNTITFKAVSGHTILLDRIRIYQESESSIPKSYYFSAEGDDANEGTMASPWKTLAKASQIAQDINTGGLLKPGDQLLFKRGDTFEGNLILKCSGTALAPITISSYGEGELPVISGSGNIDGGDYFEAMKLINTSFLDISHLWIKNDRKNMSRFSWGHEKSFGILVVANNWGVGVAEGLTFHDLKFSDIFGDSLPEDFDALNVTGLRFESDSNKVDKEITIRDVLIEDCFFTNIGKAGVWSIHKGKTTEEDSVNRSINFVIRNNEFQKTGGSGVILSKVHNALVENNLFDHTGYSTEEEPRLVGRGSGMWVFSSNNIIAQYNESYSVRGPNDSYGLHIDFGNKNILYQYNYTEDCEGGFVEILGDNTNVAYRFNVSVNDGFRDFHGNTLWTSGFVGTTTVDGIKVQREHIPSDSVYIYNNTVYIDKPYTPDITMYSKNTYVYNNIFVHEGEGRIGDIIELEMEEDFIVSNNLFFGNVNEDFSKLDTKALMKDPLFKDKGKSQKENYQILEKSPVINAGQSFPEPSFYVIGKGIFKDVTPFPQQDIFGNSLTVSTQIPNIGADNNFNTNTIVETPDYNVSFGDHFTELSVGDVITLDLIIDHEKLALEDFEFIVDDENIATITNNILIAKAEGEVTVTAINTSFNIEASITFSITENNQVTSTNSHATQVMVYPNPATGQLSINTRNWDGPKQVTMTNLLGVNYLITEINQVDVINVSSLPRGIYVLQIKGFNDEIYRSKITLK